MTGRPYAIKHLHLGVDQESDNSLRYPYEQALLHPVYALSKNAFRREKIFAMLQSSHLPLQRSHIYAHTAYTEKNTKLEYLTRILG